jgi:hypothetical protein
VEDADQADRLPDSKPSLKIRSGDTVAEGITGVSVGTPVAVGVGGRGVFVGSGVEVNVCVEVGGTGVCVNVLVG